MRAIVVATLLILTACGSAPAHQAGATFQPSASHGPTSSDVASQSRTSTPAPLSISSAPPAGGLLFAVVEGGSGENPDTVAIVGLDGYARAKAKFQSRQPIYAGGSPIERSYVPLQAVAQVVGDRVFYIDGYGAIRALRVGSQPQLLATFAQQPSQFETWFAVSPDGSSFVAGQLQFPAVGPAPSGGAPSLVGTWKFNYARADAGGPTQVLRHFETADITKEVNTFPVGWIATGPVAMVPLYIWTQTLWAGGPIFLVDAKGALSTRVGGADCDSAASITRDGLVACGGAVRDATGRVKWTTQVAFGDPRQVHISPDGNALAGNDCSPVDGSQVEVRGHGLVGMPAGFCVEGWMDSNTVVGRVVQSNGAQGNLTWISLGAPTKLHDLGFKGDFVATLG